MNAEVQMDVVKVSLPNGAVVGVEVARPRGPTDISSLKTFDFKEVQRVIEGLAATVEEAMAKARPNRATAELGLDLKVETGQLTGVLVKAGGAASLKISLTWERQPSSATHFEPAASSA